ncbi:putative membrane domain protein [Neisseria meningitidis NM604]|nr:putative membrane domain protein [Neisseria meningitidis NM604]EOB87462.1 putative membrane domain protein [Neisseria meningitidis NM604]
MDSLMTLLSVLIPMFAGFFIRVPKPYLPAWIRCYRSWCMLCCC